MLDFNAATEVLILAAKAGLITVGGQAVNGWCETYQLDKTNPWEELQPFTSEDIDLCGTAVVLRKFIGNLEQAGYTIEVILPQTEEEEKINLAVIMAKKGTEEIGINCIRTVLGVSIEELRTTKQEFEGPVFIMHPLLCLEGKIRNLAELDQSQRQDEKHVRLSIANLHEHLKAPECSTPHQKLIHERVIDLSKSGAGFFLLKNYNIQVLDSLLDSREVLFLKEDMQKEVAREITNEDWIRAINPNPYKRVKEQGHLSKYPHLPSNISEVSPEII